MAFSNIPAVQDYIDTYLITNGTDSITGAQLNTALTGMLQFVPTTGSYTTSVTSAGAAFGLVTIPLDFTPTFSYAQATSNPATNYFVVYNTAPTTNGIILYYQTNFTGTYSYTINYIAI